MAWFRALSGGGGGGGAQYKSGTDTLPSSGTKTITCGFEPKVVTLRFLPQSGKDYRESFEYNKTMNENVSTIQFSQIIYTTSGTVNTSLRGVGISGLHVNSFTITSDGFTIGASNKSNYSTSFEYEIFG